MYDIQLNESGTRHMQITDEYLQTIRKYNLFQGLINSSGYITETELDKLKLNLRSLIVSSTENTKELLDLCIDVVYHDKMKAYGLRNLIEVFGQWEAQQKATENQAKDEVSA